jgi:hypothetical protein
MNDYEYGVACEDKAIPILNEFFNDDLVKVAYRYSPYDFTGRTTLYELKSNRYKISRYPHAVIPAQKIRAYQSIPTPIILVFSYEEETGIQYYYMKLKYKKFIKKYSTRVLELRRGGICEIFDIPTCDLTKIII